MLPRMRFSASVLARLADIGVPAGMRAEDAKHVRFCNLATLCGLVCAVVFWLLEIPVIADWGALGVREAGIILVRGAGAALFALPFWLNRRHRHAAARLGVIGLSLVFVLSSSVLFGTSAPSHLFVIVIASAAHVLFPEEERVTMRWVLGVCVATFAAMLWLRHQNEPMVTVERPEIRLAMEVFISIGALVLAIFITRALRVTARRSELQAIHEQERADRLLLNILPEQIARRLKEDPRTIADGFHDVTVLFADLVGFTPMSESMTPSELLRLMDRVFSRFDELVDQFGLEKIKTVGDAYMLAGGLPDPNHSHAEDVAGMALAMLQEVRQIHGPHGEPLSIRIGIATGPVVAGVIGRKKFLYDLWGDTVNTASRMESCAEANTIQVNESTWRRLKDRFRFRERGEIEIKGKGRVATWFLEGSAA
ncbi:MAG: adenylate/guanylate cyclase domain-containing protein [Verrucomicrobiaceae bacterium]|nr:adenylate/guanylate cyclase domain-containing protein [Verrucomicrobiaceae bacterium]